MQGRRFENVGLWGWLTLAVALLAGSTSIYGGSLQEPAEPKPSLDGAVGWINSGPIELESLKGKIVLLDFWTYCCINCHHILPDLEKLEKKYGKELVVIGVHSGKFDAERDTENIRKKVAEYRIKHPVANDAEMRIWERFGASGWPTLTLIDPDGNVVGSRSGEGNYELFDRVIGELAAKFRKAGKLNEKPIEFATEESQYADKALLFPGKVLADAGSNRLFISDTGHNRIVQTDLNGGDPVVIGDGGHGLVDGSYAKARFNRQQGMCLEGDVLYVADTENHAIRAIDLKKKEVTTVVGDGQQAQHDPRHVFVGPGKTSQISSPWDVIQIPGSRTIYIAMAGPHQIWKFDPADGTVRSWAGSGRENILDGDLRDSNFAQPSGLATDGKHLFVADSEVSGVRIITGLSGPEPKVGRIVGKGLFDYGDRDGKGPEQVRLQHCLGLAYGDGKLFIADTYNNKVKACDPATATVATFVGTNESGDTDVPPTFYQPGGLSVVGDNLYVADTNNHKIKVVNLKTKTARTLEIPALKPPVPLP
ncbi:thioredoxin-like domain-containing protein [Paludisphaera borealis]|uniref:Thiol-disulfide oxidoreductase YkuV n=1 Tax=Paludisphaera borealis TaxID=1387353 RepID=A0A1U7CVT4_9BACT|nr:thioredoxin-like domain-containing protein [Paludisphaera borealis]APW63054.1 Thiol-disulfide oxidoreductase YkuV [Paludisphaera borealis]